MEKRKASLEKIDSFIENTNRNIDELLRNFGWNRDGLRSTNENSKQVGQNSSNVVKTICNRSSKDPPEKSLPESFLSEKHPCSIKFDFKPEHAPKSHKDLITNFTREERLAMYEYAVASTVKQESPSELQLNFSKQDNQSNLTSLADIAAYRRDVRRRTQKYRLAKKPLSYQEEMRNLIQLQSEALTEYLGQMKNSGTREKTPDREKETDLRGGPSKPRRSRSREKQRRSDRDDSKRHRDREHKKRKRSRSRSRSKSRPRHKSKKKRSNEKIKH